jgi:FxsC-like protein
LEAYYPPKEDPVTLLAQRVAVAEKLNYEMLPLDDSLIDNLRNAENSNKIVVIIVDSWSLHVERYRQKMCRYDQNRFRNCVVMVPWNEGDGDTKIKAAQLQSILRKTFSRQPKTVFRSLIRSSEQFMEAISSALNEGRRNILDLLDVFRKAEGDAVSYESGQIVEFHRIARGAVRRGV